MPKNPWMKFFFEGSREFYGILVGCFFLKMGCIRKTGKVHLPSIKKFFLRFFVGCLRLPTLGVHNLRCRELCLGGSKGKLKSFLGRSSTFDEVELKPFRVKIPIKGVWALPCCFGDNKLFNSPLCKNWPYWAQLTLEHSFGIAKTESGPSGRAGWIITPD